MCPTRGYAEAAGSLQLPVTDQFSELASLLGERTRLRVWWRSGDDWRVDAIKTAGEIDLFHSASLTTQWDYEAEEATTSVEQRIRLPRSSDLLPPQLGRLVLRDARPDEVTRIAAEPIAGVEAAGLRLVPAEPQSTIDHVDVWADPATGLPVRVEVYAEGADVPALDHVLPRPHHRDSVRRTDPFPASARGRGGFPGRCRRRRGGRTAVRTR